MKNTSKIISQLKFPSMDIFNAGTRDRIAKNVVNLHLIPKKKDYDELLEAMGDAPVVLIGQ
jgi:2-iminoacetate synthase ThiH